MDGLLGSMPDRAEWGRVWLGTGETVTADDAGLPATGWYETASETRFSDLATLERRMTIGAATKDSQDIISSWSNGDWTGGSGIEEMDEGANANRFWWGEADTRFPHHVTLPPLVTKVRPTDSSTHCFPLAQLNSVVYFVFQVGGAYKLYGYREFNGGWTSVVDFPARPVDKAVLFGTSIWVPCGFDGIVQVAESSEGVPVVTHHAGAATPDMTFPIEPDDRPTSNPRAIALCSFEDNLWALTPDGYIAKSWEPETDDQWTWPVDDMRRRFVRVTRSGTPRQLIPFFNKAGEPTLFASATDGLYMFQPNIPGFQQTPVQVPNHPDIGGTLAMWRPGEDLWMAAGMDAIRYTTNNVVVPMTGPARDDGVPAAYRGKIVDLCPEMSHLYMLTTAAASSALGQTSVEDGGLPSDDALYPPDASGANTALFAWTGVGLHPIWTADPSQGEPSWMIVSSVVTSNGDPAEGYRLWWGMSDGNAYTMRLRRTFHNPRQGQEAGIDEFAETGYQISPRFDASMIGWDKLASHVTVFMDRADEANYAAFFYRTDLAPDTWVPFGVANRRGRNDLPLKARPGDGYASGAFFNWIQVFWQMVRSPGDFTQTPVMNSWSLNYQKVAQKINTFTFTIPLLLDGAGGRGPQQQGDDLQALLRAREMVVLVHRNRRYRGRVTQVAGSDATGPDWSGVRTVQFVEIGTGDADWTSA